MTDDLPVFAWGESVIRSENRLSVPLNRDGATVADLELSEQAARLLADMLHDAAGPEQCLYRGPYGLGPPCRLDAREHYHYAQHPSGCEAVVRYGSPEDLTAFPPDGRLG